MPEKMKEQGFYAFEDTLRHHAYILLCQLFAKHEFEKLAYYPDCDDAVNHLLGMEEPELNRNIMSLAALSRANDDARDGLSFHHKNEHPLGVGILTINGDDKVLTAREACNKIIHCKEAKLDFEISPNNPLYAQRHKDNRIKDDKEYRVPFLILKGQEPGKNGQKWDARVNMVQWVMAVANFAV